MKADIVLEGGGVRGIGLVGALTSLSEAGYSFRRVAGASAGAIVGALTAAGMSPQDMAEAMQTLDYTKFRDKGTLSKLGVPGKVASLAFKLGVYEGDYLESWLEAQLDALGVRTFGDLKLRQDWAVGIPSKEAYALTVIVTDVTRGRLVRLPWDYREYGLDPDTQSVAHAVRASMSIAFYYKPAHIGKSLMIDGGMLSNFPIDLFDSTPDWPTFGIKLSAKLQPNQTMNPVTGPFSYARSILGTITNAHDQLHLDDPEVLRRTMFVDTTAVKATNFDITKEQQAALFARGQESGKQFIETWQRHGSKH